MLRSARSISRLVSHSHNYTRRRRLLHVSATMQGDYNVSASVPMSVSYTNPSNHVLNRNSK